MGTLGLICSLLCSTLAIGLFSSTEMVSYSSIVVFLLSFSFQEELYSSGLWMDFMSWSMVILSFFVFSMVSFSLGEGSKILNFSLLSLFIVVFFFLTSSIGWFFVLFEMSLIPLMFLILSWGAQAERLVATQFMMVFTIVGSAPLLFFIIQVTVSGGNSLVLHSLLPLSYGSTVGALSMIAFFVKIPLFFFHSWLPKAHVEAPLQGSMILAGIMLKVGLFGLIRMMMIQTPMWEVLFSVSMIGSLLSSVIALSSDDMKMSVAFSSISHMNMAMTSVFSMKLGGVISSMIIMISHGLSSPLLFYLVTMIYHSTHSRSVLISKGVVSKIPLIWLFGLLLWVANISAPPFMSFIGELMAFSSVVSFINLSVLWVVVFLVVGSFYSIVNFGVLSHSSYKLHMKESSKSFPFLLSALVMVVSLVMMFFFPIYNP